MDGEWVVADCREVRLAPVPGRAEAVRERPASQRPGGPGTGSLAFDGVQITEAAAMVAHATEHVASLGGVLPDDLRGWGELRAQVEELSRGLIVLTALADQLRHQHDRATARWTAALLAQASRDAAPDDAGGPAVERCSAA